MRLSFKTLVGVSLFALASRGFAMQNPGPIQLQGPTQSITIAGEQALLSSTLRALLEEIDLETVQKNDRGIPILPVPNLDHCLPLIGPYFNLAQPENEGALKAQLRRQTSEQLMTIINAFNYLDLDSIRNAALEILAERMVQEENLYSCLKNADGSYHLPLPLDMQHELAHKMLTKLPTSKSILLFNNLLMSTKGRFPYKELSGHTHTVQSLCFNAADTLLATASADSTIKLWNPETGVLLNTLRGHTEYVSSICFNPAGTLLASAAVHEGAIKIWNPVTGILRNTLISPGACSVAFNPTGTLLAAACIWSGTIELWDPARGVLINTLSHDNNHGVESLCFNARGTLLASASRYGSTIKLWNPETGVLLNTMQGNTGQICSMCFNTAGTLLATGGEHGIELWDPATGALVNTLTGHTHCVTSLCFNGADTLLASTANDATIKLWDPFSGLVLHTLQGFSAVCFNASGTLLAGGWGPSIKLWTMADTELNTLFNKKKIKPEQLALLAYMTSCKQQNIPLDLNQYPGIIKIKVPGNDPRSWWQVAQNKWHNLNTPTKWALSLTAVVAMSIVLPKIENYMLDKMGKKR